jgi:Fe2+ transport system protein FeoA
LKLTTLFNSAAIGFQMTAPSRLHPPNDALALADLAPGAVGVVQTVDASSPIGRRLLDLGFVPQTRVYVVRRAPLGDPLEFELRGTRFCLRRSEAARILVRRV